MAEAAAERGYGLLAVGLSEGRRGGARLESGERMAFGLDASRRLVTVPYPPSGWSARAVTCGIALQCAPSKDRLGELGLTSRELRAVTLAEGEAALGWVASQWPGLLPDL